MVVLRKGKEIGVRDPVAGSKNSMSVDGKNKKNMKKKKKRKKDERVGNCRDAKKVAEILLQLSADQHKLGFCPPKKEIDVRPKRKREMPKKFVDQSGIQSLPVSKADTAHEEGATISKKKISLRAKRKREESKKFVDHFRTHSLLVSRAGHSLLDTAHEEGATISKNKILVRAKRKREESKKLVDLSGTHSLPVSKAGHVNNADVSRITIDTAREEGATISKKKIPVRAKKKREESKKLFDSSGTHSLPVSEAGHVNNADVSRITMDTAHEEGAAISKNKISVRAKKKRVDSKKVVDQSGTHSLPVSQAGHVNNADVSRTTLDTAHESAALGGIQASPESLDQSDVKRMRSAPLWRGSIGTSPALGSSFSHLSPKIWPPFKSGYQPLGQGQSASISRGIGTSFGLLQTVHQCPSVNPSAAHSGGGFLASTVSLNQLRDLRVTAVLSASRASIGTSSGLETVQQSPSVQASAAQSVGGFQAAPSLVNVPSLASTVSLNQLSVNAVQSVSVSRASTDTSSGLHTVHQPPAHSNEGFRAAPSVVHVPSLAPAVLPNQLQSASVSRPLNGSINPSGVPGVTEVGQGNKAPDTTPNRDGPTEVTHKVAVPVVTDQNLKPSGENVHETVSVHQASQVTNYQQSLVFPNGSNIGRNLQQILDDLANNRAKHKLALYERREKRRAEREAVNGVESVDENRRILAQRIRRAKERAENKMKRANLSQVKVSVHQPSQVKVSVHQPAQVTNYQQSSSVFSNPRDIGKNGITDKVAVQVITDQNLKPSVQSVHGVYQPSQVKVSVHQPAQVTNYQQSSSVFPNHCDFGKNGITDKVAVQVITDQNSKPSVQSVHEKVSVHQPSQVNNYRQFSPAFSNHSYIGKNVQKKILHDATVRPNKRKLAQRQRRERELAGRKAVKEITRDPMKRILAQQQRRQRELAERRQRELAEKKAVKVATEVKDKVAVGAITDQNLKPSVQTIHEKVSVHQPFHVTNYQRSSLIFSNGSNRGSFNRSLQRILHDLANNKAKHKLALQQRRERRRAEREAVKVVEPVDENGTTKVTDKVAVQDITDQNLKPSVQTAHEKVSVHQPSQVTNYQQSSSVFSDHRDISKNVATSKVAVEVITNQSIKPSVQTVHEKVSVHQPSQVTNYQQSSSVSNHSDGGKNIQRILHDITLRPTKRKLAQRQRRERELAEKEAVKSVESVNVVDDSQKRILAQRLRRERERAEKEAVKLVESADEDKQKLTQGQRPKRQRAERKAGKVVESVDEDKRKLAQRAEREEVKVVESVDEDQQKHEREQAVKVAESVDENKRKLAQRQRRERERAEKEKVKVVESADDDRQRHEREQAEKKAGKAAESVDENKRKLAQRQRRERERAEKEKVKVVESVDEDTLGQRHEREQAEREEVKVVESVDEDKRKLAQRQRREREREEKEKVKVAESVDEDKLTPRQIRERERAKRKAMVESVDEDKRKLAQRQRRERERAEIEAVKVVESVNQDRRLSAQRKQPVREPAEKEMKILPRRRKMERADGKTVEEMRKVTGTRTATT